MVGGWLDSAFGWRAVFLFLAAMGLLIFALVAAWMPETLPQNQRQPIHPVSVARAYGGMFSSLSFMLLALMFGINFGGLFIYIASAPELIYVHLGYGAHDFWRMFVPVVLGIVVGSFLAGRLAHRLTSRQGVTFGFVLMAVAALLNVALTHLPTQTAVTLIAPVALYAMGMALSMPGLSLLGLDMYPARRGMASAVQGFIQMSSNGLLAAFVVTLLAASVQWLAWGQLVIALSALVLWGAWIGLFRRA